MPGARHSRSMLYSQSDILHAPTCPIADGSPPLDEATQKVSQCACLLSPMVIASAWQARSRLYAQVSTVHSFTRGISMPSSRGACEPDHPTQPPSPRLWGGQT